MWKYITKRLLLCVIILLGVSVIVYTLVRMMPTDYIDQKYSAQLGQGTIKQSDIDRMKKLYGLYLPDARVKMTFDKEAKESLGKSSFELGFNKTNWEDKLHDEINVEWFVGEYTNGAYTLEIVEGGSYKAYEYYTVYFTPDSQEIYQDEGGAFVLYDDLRGVEHKIYVSEFGAGYTSTEFFLMQGTDYIFVIENNENRILNSTTDFTIEKFIPAKSNQITGFNASTFKRGTTTNPNLLSEGKLTYNYVAETDTHVLKLTETGTEKVFQAKSLKVQECNGWHKLGYILSGYFTWLSNLARGDLGESFLANQPVAEVIKKNMWVSFTISLIALVLQFAISIPLGIASATHQYGILDYSVTVLAMLGISLPSFFLGRLLISLFAVKLGWLPSGGLGTTNETFDSGWLAFWDKVPYIILPMFVLVILSIGGLMRYTRTNMLEVLNSDYIRTARAKGLSEKTVIYKHAFKNTMIPLVTMLAGTLPGLFGGAMITEQVFGLPGIGNQAYKALTQGDVPFIMGYNMFLAVLGVIGVLASDLMYMLVDPRVKISK